MSLRLSVEVVGAFVFTWGERILLAGRSQGFLPEVFSSSLELNSSDFYFFHLEYCADPSCLELMKNSAMALRPERTDQEMLTFSRRTGERKGILRILRDVEVIVLGCIGLLD